ncbi:MAG: hypothetical protein LBD44_05805 [Spirochaetaceae bacterium]|nr:hypothetical protein [Spirochaetaceae bacterium]
MSEASKLSLFYRRYVDGNLSKHELEAHIFKYVLCCPNGYYGLVFKDEGDRIDFLCWVYPIMRRAIDRYNSRLASFGVYIATTLGFSFRYYKRHKLRRSIAEIDCWKASGDGSYVCEPEIDDESANGMYVNCGSNLQKHIMLVLLKSFYYVSDSLVDKAAAAIGMAPEELGEMVAMLRRLQIKKIEKLQNLADAAHCLYYRCLAYEKKLSQKNENTHLNKFFSRRLDKGRKRLANMRERISAMRIEATNNELSKVMGIPKGTVDSRWALIKNKRTLNKLMPQMRRNGSDYYEDVDTDFLWQGRAWP